MKCRNNHAWEDCTCGPEEGQRTSIRAFNWASAITAAAIVAIAITVLVGQ